MTLCRREVIVGIGLVGLVGCTGSSGDDEGSGEDPVEVGTSAGGVSLVRHRFEAPEIGPKLFATIRNSRDADFDLGELMCRVYDGDELVGDSYRTISMSGNETEEFDLLFAETERGREELRSTTHYEITVDVSYTNGATDEIQAEFDKPVQFAEGTDGE